MKSVKYTAIIMALILLYLLGRFVWAALEHGLPTQPVYYIASVVEIGLGFLTYKLFTFLPRKVTTKLKKAKLFAILLLALMVFCIGVPIAMYYSNIEALQPAGAAWGWYIVSGMALGLYWIIKRARTGTELTEAEQTHEYMSKGLVLSFLIITSCFLFMLLILFLIISLSTC